MNTLKDRLKSAMQRNGITQQELAVSVGVTQPAIGKLVRGETSNSRYLFQIAKSLNVSLEWLVSGDGDPQRGMRADPSPDPPNVVSEISSPNYINETKNSSIIDEFISLFRELTEEQQKQVIDLMRRQKRENDEIIEKYQQIMLKRKPE